MSAATFVLFAAIGFGATESPVPFDSTAAAIDQELIVNAVPTHIREWRVNRSLNECADFYRSYLGEHCVEFKSVDGIVLAAPHAQRFVTVELQSLAPRQTRARVSEANLNAVTLGSSVIPLPPDAKLLSRVGSKDGTLATQTLMASSPTGIGPNADFFKRRLAAFGMRLSNRRVIDGAGRQGEILAFSGVSRSAEVVMTRERDRTWISVTSFGPPP